MSRGHLKQHAGRAVYKLLNQNGLSVGRRHVGLEGHSVRGVVSRESQGVGRGGAGADVRRLTVPEGPQLRVGQAVVQEKWGGLKGSQQLQVEVICDQRV